jgi:hypothetical protein
MKIKHRSILFHSFILLICPLLWMGCASMPKPPPPVQTADFSRAATELVQRLEEKGLFDKVATPPAKLRILTIVNNTSDHFDVDLFTQKIRVALTESGKVIIQNNPAIPVDYILSGKIISTYTSTSEHRERTYTFQLALTDPQGAEVWAGESEFTK